MAQEIIKKSMFVGGLTVALDAIFHYYFSSPMEVKQYFFIKFFVASFITYLVLIRFRLPLIDLKTEFQNRLAYSILFALIFSLYYRFNEYFYGLGFGSRIPTIILGTTTISPENLVLQGLIWGLVHGGAFLISLLIMDRR